MADSHVWEEDPVKLKVNARGMKYSNKTVKFVFKTDDDKETDCGSADVAIKQNLISDNSASGTLPKTKKVTDIGGDDALCYKMKYAITVDGESKGNFTDKIWVHVRSITVTAVDAKDGTTKFKGALCRITQNAAAGTTGGGTYTSLRQTDANGKIVFPLRFPSSDVTIEWVAPFRAEWLPDKDKGTKREAKITYSPKAKLVYPPSAADLKHYVNVDADPKRDDDATAEDKKHREYGRKLRVIIEAADVAGCDDGQPVYVHAKFDAKNSDRKGAAKGKGLGFDAETTLAGPKRRGFVDIDLGPAGGDVVEIEIGTKKGIKDDSAKVTTWRRLYYELLAAECIASAMPAGTHVDGSAGFDVPAKTKQKATTILKDSFIEYVLRKSQRFPDSSIPDHEKATSEYWGEPAGKTLVTYAGTGLAANDALPFGTEDLAHTVHVRLAHRTISANAKSRKTVVGHTQEFTACAVVSGKKVVTMDLSALKGRLFPKFPGVGTPGVTNATWTAELTGLGPPTPPQPPPPPPPKGAPPLPPPLPPPPHPATDGSGNARTGLVTVKYVNVTNVAFELPPEAANLIGTAGTPAKCPISISCDLLLSTGLTNGSANSGRQVLKLTADGPECNGTTMCHELGHLMGMTIAPGASKTPDGMPAPKHVDNGGTYYRDGSAKAKGIRTSGAGSHCAEGLSATDKAKASYSGLSGSCVMFESGNSSDPPTRAGFCAKCVEYIKARNLANIRHDWSAVADTDA
jgi:hypothetical protein